MAPGGKRSGDQANAGPVPIQRPRTQGSEDAQPLISPSEPPRPQLPTNTEAEARGTMRGMAAWVKHFLRDALKTARAAFAQFPDIKEHLHQPLDIKDKTAGKSELTSFKAPWTMQSAVTSLKTTGLFEAAANILWCRPFTSTDDEETLAGTPLWAQVDEVRRDHFTLTEVQRSQDDCKIARLIFPITIPVHVDGIAPQLLALAMGDDSRAIALLFAPWGLVPCT